MGIKGINPFVKRYAPDAYFTMPIDQLAGKRIAIDGNNWMYTNMAIARKKVINRTDVAVQEPNQAEIRREWFLAAINFIVGWLSSDITPVFVFDGEHLPEKGDTKTRRHDIRMATRAKIDALYAQLRNTTIERPGNIVEEIRKELRNYVCITSEDFELFKMIIKGIGIPCLQAVADGEQLCSMLCVDGKVAAVFSVDTDNLVYGCPLIVTGFSDTFTYDDQGNRISHLDCVRHDRVLAGLQITQDVFVDLCIMCGCDFNTNMPGYAAIKSYTLLQKWGSIDKLPRDFNTDCLKYIRCRDIFKYVNSDSLVARPEATDNDEESPRVDYEGLVKLPVQNIGPFDINKRAIITARDYLEMVGVSAQIERIINCYNHTRIAQDGYVESLKLAPAPRYVPPVPVLTLTINRIPAAPIIPVNTKQPTFLTLNVINK